MKAMEFLNVITQIPALLRLKSALRPRPLDTFDSIGARVEDTTARFGNETAVIFEGSRCSWQQLNALANRYCGALRSQGLKRGDTASLFMENRIEYLALLIGLNKLGVTAALINTNLSGRPLVHCMTITNAKINIFGEERINAVEQVVAGGELDSVQCHLFVSDSGLQPCPDWAQDMQPIADAAGNTNPPDTQNNTLGDIALNIFTSGTTGLPKAAVISNRRFLTSAVMSWEAGLRCKTSDRIYLCLPLYHGTGLFLGAGAAFATGACMVLRRKFSATQFLPEVREHGATCFIYIGELCRYLLNTPQQPDDDRSPLKKVMGNGLRPDVWHEFKARFGIERVAEFYGSSEGNIGFVNLLNKDCTVGATTLPMALVKYDIENDSLVYDANGKVIEVDDGEPGLLIGKITSDTAFEGYTNKQDTDGKILRNALEDGDAWFNSGDLMKTVDVGFALGFKHYQFVDRIGDTFRWKSENVSTNEVGEIICTHPQISLCNVYGVEIPGAEGKAGMAAITLSPGETSLDLDSLSRWITEQLPHYAQPVFLRVQQEMDTTGTFKMLKGDLRKEGYDLAQVTDPLYVLKPRSTRYEPLDATFAQTLREGQGGY